MASPPTDPELRRLEAFVQVASHELKTPLTTLSLQLELLERTLKHEQITAARAQVARLGRLIDHLRDVSQLEDIPLRTQPEPLDLGALLRELVEGFRPRTGSLAQLITLRVDERVIGLWDRFYVDRMLGNLLSNAIKFGEGKPIDVRLEAVRAGTAVITIRDRGKGIPPEYHERLFQKFERAGAGPEVEGLGLGLYIVRRIVEAHGGKVRIESAPGWGTAIWIELPELSEPDCR